MLAPAHDVVRVLPVARLANSVAFALQGFFLAVVLTELPRQRDRFHLTDGIILAAVVMVSLLAALGSLLAERVALRWSSRTALRLGLLLVAAAGLVIALAPSLPVLFVTLAAYGIAVGLVDASTNMQAIFIQHGYGRIVLSSFYAAWSAGSILGALFVAGYERLQVSFPATFATAAAIVFVGGLLLGPYLLSTRHAESDPAEQGHAGIVPLRSYLPFGVTMALVFATDLAVGDWSALYLKRDLASSAATAALALAAYQGAALVSRLTGDWWARWLGPRLLVRTAAGVGVVGLAIVVTASTPTTALVGFLVAGLGLPVVAPLCFSEIGQITGGRGLDAVIARLNLFDYAGTLVGGGLVGAVADGGGYRVGFALPLAFAVVVLAGARYFHRRGGAPKAANVCG